jgi:hypothetical protein
MQEINFGCIEGLQIDEGEPVLTSSLRLIHEFRFGKENGSNRKRVVQDFTLRKEIVELFDYFDREQSITIESLEVQHGLPFRMTVAESARV